MRLDSGILRRLEVRSSISIWLAVVQQKASVESVLLTVTDNLVLEAHLAYSRRIHESNTHMTGPKF